MPTTPTTAPTLEERVKAAIREWLASGRLAAILDNPALFEKEIAAMLRQHSAPLEAQIAELTAERDAALERVTELEAALVPAYEGGVDHAFEVAKEAAAGELAAAQERERAYREALTLAANRLDRCAIDHPTGTNEQSERAEWAEEARAALQTKEDANGR